MTPLQVVVVLFALFAFSRTLLRLRDSKISMKEFLLWNIVWVSIAVIVFQPWVTDMVSQKFGISRGIDFVVYITVLVILYLIFRLFVQLESMEQEMTKIASAIALQNPKKKS